MLITYSTEITDNVSRETMGLMVGWVVPRHSLSQGADETLTGYVWNACSQLLESGIVAQYAFEWRFPNDTSRVLTNKYWTYTCPGGIFKGCHLVQGGDISSQGYTRSISVPKDTPLDRYLPSRTCRVHLGSMATFAYFWMRLVSRDQRFRNSDAN